MSNLKNYTSQVPAAKTINEIIELLVSHGAMKVQQDYEDHEPTAISWSALTNHGPVAFTLPVDVKRCYELMRRQKLLPRGEDAAMAQARRTAWRTVKDWIAAQMALLQTDMVTLEQLMLPYAVDSDGVTLYERVMEGGYKALGSGTP